MPHPKLDDEFLSPPLCLSSNLLSIEPASIGLTVGPALEHNSLFATVFFRHCDFLAQVRLGVCDHHDHRLGPGA